MAFKTRVGPVVVLTVVLSVLAASAKAQLYAGPGSTVLGQTWSPSYGYPYSYATPGPYSYYWYAYPPGPWYVFPSVPPPSRYVAPSLSYNANPYAQFPNSFSYEVPPNAYAPGSYTYDLRAYGYGYPPPYYPYTYSYYPGYRPYYPVRPLYGRGAYRSMTLREYIARQLHGPVRVRDVVPGQRTLGG